MINESESENPRMVESLPRSLNTDRSIDTIRYVNNFAMKLSDDGKHDAAKRLLEAALQAYEARRISDPITLSTITRNLGLQFCELWDHVSGRRLLERALTIRRPYMRRADLALAFLELGNVLSKAWDMPGAEIYYRRALMIYQTVFGLDHPDVASKGIKRSIILIPPTSMDL